MPGNTSNFNNHHEVAYSFCLDSYIFNAYICIEQKLLAGPASHPAPRSLVQCDVTGIICISYKVKYLDTVTKILSKKLYCNFK